MSSRKNILDLSKKYFKSRTRNLAKQKILTLKPGVKTSPRPTSNDSKLLEVPLEVIDQSDVLSHNDANISSAESIQNDTSSDSDFTNDVFEDKDDDRLINDFQLKSELAALVVKHSSVPNSFVNDLLVTLRRAGHKLPIDVRTLKKCPIQKKINEMTTGSFVYFGLELHLRNFLMTNKSISELDLSFNIDGLPLTKSLFLESQLTQLAQLFLPFLRLVYITDTLSLQLKTISVSLLLRLIP